jgi:hypothetical protein
MGKLEVIAMMTNPRETKQMSRFFVTFEVANNDDLAAVRRGDLEPDKVRRVMLSGLVDSGASRLVLPKAVVEQLSIIIPSRSFCRPRTRQWNMLTPWGTAMRRHPTWSISKSSAGPHVSQGLSPMERQILLPFRSTII